MADFTGMIPQASKAPDGRIWFTAVDGINVIDPRHLAYNKLPPPVNIEHVTADRKTYDVADVTGGVRLPLLVRDLEIDYTALSLVVPEKNRFRIKLEGYDRDWQDVGNRRQAFYSNLPPRNYRFRVIASNNSGVWNEAGDALEFSIAPAYYQTTWFRLSCVAAFLALLWTLYQLRLQQLAREFNAGLEARVNERTRIARELHDSLITLMDLQMPEMNGIDAVIAIRGEFPKARIIVLTTYAADALCQRAMQAGAHAYILKGDVRKALLDMIRAVHAGKG